MKNVSIFLEKKIGKFRFFFFSIKSVQLFFCFCKLFQCLDEKTRIERRADVIGRWWLIKERSNSLPVVNNEP